jgi:amino acid transporter
VTVTVLGIGILYCFFASLIPWTIGANLAAAESAQQGDLPKVFARTHPRRGTPVGAAMASSIVGTVVTVGYATLFSLTNGAVDDLFWNLFAFSSVIFLLPYIVMMLAFRKLRRTDPDRPRPYRVPGGRVSEVAITWITTLLLGAAAAFFVWNPFDYTWQATGSILIGLAITFAIQEIFCRKSSQWTVQRAIERHEQSEPEASLVSTGK